MNLELIYTASIFLTALALICEISELYRPAVAFLFFAALGYGFATGWWAYSKYHGVF